MPRDSAERCGEGKRVAAGLPKTWRSCHGTGTGQGSDCHQAKCSNIKSYPALVFARVTENTNYCSSLYPSVSVSVLLTFCLSLAMNIASSNQPVLVYVAE